MVKGVKTSAVRALILRELSKGPRTTEQLAEASGASRRHINIYLKEQGAVVVAIGLDAGLAPRQRLYALPGNYGTTVEPAGT